MGLQKLCCLGLIGLSPMAYAADSIYCPTGHAYINLGMNSQQVLSACGKPQSKQVADGMATQRVPVKQLIYSTLNQGSVYPTLNPIYTAWSLPSGSTGTSMQINIIDNKVASVTINGRGEKAMNLCHGGNVSPGAPEIAAINACGNPDLINNSFIDMAVPSKNRPEVWVYQLDKYQPSLRLTFVDGKLQSIE